MKITTTAHNVNPSTELRLCFDVSKDYFTRYEHDSRLVCIEDEIENGTDAIEHILSRCTGLAEEAGRKHLRVLCEAAGGYERKIVENPCQPRLGLYNPATTVSTCTKY